MFLNIQWIGFTKGVAEIVSDERVRVQTGGKDA